MTRQQILEAMFANPIMLDDLDFLYKDDMARKILFYHQPKEEKKEEEVKPKGRKDPRVRKNQGLAVMQEKDKVATNTKEKVLFITDGTTCGLASICMYFIRLSSRRSLGEETFQREILTGVVSATASENIIWYFERIVSNVFIPLLNSKKLDEKGSEVLRFKVRKELLPCLRSFTSCLRVAEMVWCEGLLIDNFPPESHTIKNLDDSWAVLATEDGQARFEEAVRGWMKSIYELLLESEQLRLETDDAGPQDELEYWKSRAARLSLLVDQISSNSCKMVLVTLKAAQCKMLKVIVTENSKCLHCVCISGLEGVRDEGDQVPCGGH